MSNECLAKLNERSAECPTADVVNFYLHVVARLDDAAFFGLEDDLLEIVRFTDKFIFIARGACFDEDFLGAADHHLVALERNGVLEIHKARVSGKLFFGRENFRLVVRFRSLARAVDEHVDGVELAGFKSFDCLFEIFVGFSHESE